MNEDVVVKEATKFLADMSSESVPLIVTDPPYGIGYHSNYYKGKNPHAPIAQDWNFQIGSFAREAGRVLKDGGAMYLFCRYDVVPVWLPLIESSGLKLKTIIIWVKDNWSAGDLEGSFGNQYEQIMFLSKGRHKIRGKRWSNVWEFPRVPAKQLFHPAQKPTALLRRAIESSSDVDCDVVDPFCGSGSTGVAARECGRGFLMCDKDEEMVRVSRARLGLPVEEKEQKPDDVLTYRWSMPNPEDWGIHPEEIQWLYEELKKNRENHNV